MVKSACSFNNFSGKAAAILKCLRYFPDELFLFFQFNQTSELKIDLESKSKSKKSKNILNPFRYQPVGKENGLRHNTHELAKFIQKRG